MTTEISLSDVTLRFRVYRNRSPGLKETVVRRLSCRAALNHVSEFDVLKNINLTIRAGERLGIVGLNGAGKSSLLKMIVGIYPPREGTVRVKGRITPMMELGTGFDYELSGRENIYLNGSLLGRSFKQMKCLEKKIIDFAELEGMIDTPVKYYSSGMHSRLAFSIGAMAQPEILLLDEIFAVGDAHFVQKASRRLAELFQVTGIVVLVSHDLEQIKRFCNKVLVLHRGTIVNQGDPPEMIDYYLREIVHAQQAS